MRKILIAAILLGAGIALPAQAASYDGNWHVTVVTEKGTCDRAYGYQIAVRGGRVHYAGDASVNLSGNVSPSGAVNVHITAGGKRASGSGRLSANGGRGTWRGTGGSDSCAGYWEAERR